MATAEVGALRVTLGLDSGAFTDGLTKAQKQLQGVGRQMQRVGTTMAAVGAGMTAAITAPLIAAGFAASKAAMEAAEAMGQVEAALVSMGNASGKTKEELGGLAEGLMRNSLYDDDDILRKVTANLLTFGNVAGDEFNRAQQAAVDLSARLGTDLQGSAIQVGKALNDPIKGITALSRVGVSFTEAQKDQIKAMAEAGNVAGAQRLILSELEKQYGGAAAAAQATDPYDRLRDSLNSLSESAGGVINRFLVPMADAAAKLLDRFNGLSPQMQTFAIAGAAVAAALGPALVVIGAVVGAVGSMVAAFGAGGALAGLAGFAVAVVPVVAAVAALAAAVYVFRDDLAPILSEFGETAQAALGPSIAQAVGAARTAFATLGPLIEALGPVLKTITEALLKAFGPIIVTVLRVMVAGFQNAFAVIGQVLRIITALLRGDWAGAWNAAGSLVMTIVRGIGNIIDAVFPGIGRTVGRMVGEVSNWLQGKLFDVLRGVIGRVQMVSDAFFKLYDAVVGNSYVPDMVEGIAEWMSKLDAGMVVPARNATDAAKSAFESLRDDVASIMGELLTETERASRELAQKTAVINRAVASRIISRAQGDQAIAGSAAIDLDRGDPVTLNPLGRDNQDIAASLREGLKKAQDAFDETARQFGDEFAWNMERVLSGDIRGAFLGMLSDVLRSSLSDIGTSLFQSFGKKGGGLDVGKIGGAISGLFGGFKLPGFSTGGSFKVGGAPGLDKNVVAFRATKGEMVDIRRDGQMPNAGGALAVHVSPSPYFDVRVERVASPVAARAGIQAFGAARAQVPADLSRQQTYRRT